MASILDKYGIKEVADLTFYHISDEGTPDYPVLYIDTAKVSTLEFTAETADARGGKGNPKLITWDFGKEITVSIEDALFSAKSMAIMFGNGSVKQFKNGLIMKTETFKAKADSATVTAAGAVSCGWSDKFEAPDGKLYAKHNAKFFAADSTAPTSFVKGETYFCSYDLLAEGAVIEVSANSFPGTYYVTGDTFARSEINGEDEFFQFIIPKAKVTSENTITLEAEGDPSVFNMNLTVLRPDSGDMVQLVKYDLLDGAKAGEDTSIDLPHNHGLDGTNSELVFVSPDNSFNYWGVSAAAAQDNILIANGKITGTSKYINDDCEATQTWGKGNFLTLKFDWDDESITKVQAGIKSLVELDADKNMLLKIDLPIEGNLQVKWTKADGTTGTEEYDLSDLVLEAAPTV